MINQHVIDFVSPELTFGETASFRAARSLLARVLPDSIASTLLGAPKQELPAPFVVHPSPRREGVRIVALGSDASNYLLDVLIDIKMALDAHLGAKVRVLIDQQAMGLFIAQRNPIRYYRIPGLVWQGSGTKPANPKWLEAGQVNPNGMTDFLERYIMGQIERICDTNNIDFDKDAARILGVHAVVMTPACVRDKAFRGRVDVQFAANFVLRGCWHVGRLASRGYGSVRIQHAKPEVFK